jgi:hypothetical protein
MGTAVLKVPPFPFLLSVPFFLRVRPEVSGAVIIRFRNGTCPSPAYRVEKFDAFD